MKPETMSSKTGPYKTEWKDGWFRVSGPTDSESVFFNVDLANDRERELNAAFLAGQESSRWIPVSERLPEDELRPVLVKTKDEAGWEQQFSAYCSEGEDPAYWILDMPMLCESQKDIRIPGVTHWQPLPKAPNT